MTNFFEAMPPGRVAYWSDAYMERQAEKSGCTVERADDYTLLVDIDNDADFEVFLAQIEVLKSLDIVFVIGWDVRPSKSGNKHIRVHFADSLSMTERILLQAVLGSDRKRELLSFAGMLKGQESPVVFFRPKAKAA